MPDALLLHDAPTFGLTRSMLRGASWTNLSRGLYQRSSLDLDESQRLAAMRQVLPPVAAWSHYTGARVLRLWLPLLPSTLPVMATVLPGATRPERHGLYVARSRARWFEPVLVGGVETLPAPLLLGQLTEDLALIDLVIAIDSALHQDGARVRTSCRRSWPTSARRRGYERRWLLPTGAASRRTSPC